MKQIQLKYSLPVLDSENKPVLEEGKKKYIEHTVNLTIPEDIDEAGQIYGKETFYNKGMAQIKIDARRLCYEAESPEQAQQFMNSFSPGVSLGRQTASRKKELLSLLDEQGITSPEDIEEMVKMLKARKENEL